MAITTVTTVVRKTVFGDLKAVFGAIVLTGTYETDGFDWTVAEMSDGYFSRVEPMVQVTSAELNGGQYIGFYNTPPDGKMVLYAPGGVVAHTHTIASHTHDVTVAAGTEADSIGFDSGGDIVSTSGGTFATDANTGALVTGSATATYAGAPEVANGTTLTNMVIQYIAYSI